MMKNLTLILLFNLFVFSTFAKEAVIIDVRTAAEYQDSHVKGSKNIDFKSSEFKSEIEKLDKTKAYKLYCRTGNRSGQALKLMQQLGFKNVENLGGLGEAVKDLNATCEGPKSC